jgi:hypothetical protein
MCLLGLKGKPMKTPKKSTQATILPETLRIGGHQVLPNIPARDRDKVPKAFAFPLVNGMQIDRRMQRQLQP